MPAVLDCPPKFYFLCGGKTVNVLDALLFGLLPEHDTFVYALAESVCCPGSKPKTAVAGLTLGEVNWFVTSFPSRVTEKLLQ